MSTFLGKRLLLILILTLPLPLWAQFIRGQVTDQKGQALAYITISLLDSNLNTYTNQTGNFELKLQPGTYQLVAHAIDFQKIQFQVQISANKDEHVQLVMKPQTYQLSEMTVSAKQTNPAVYIMRKAIAMAPYYRRQVLAYRARVYLKGNGEFEKIPGMFKKMMLQSNIEEGKPMLTESINELQFFQPNTYREKVVSLKSNMKLESAPEPMQMLRGSYYNTSNQELISPLSAQAFSVYNFTYEGSFFDAGVEVNKIKVTPKRIGSDVYEGSIYIIDKLWCIHSLNLNNNGNLFDVQSKAKFAPMPAFPFVWMPISYDFVFKGAMLGFKAKFHYLAALSNYEIKLNPNVKHTWQEMSSLQQINTQSTKDHSNLVKEMAKKSNPSKLDMLRLMVKMRKQAEQTQIRSVLIDSSVIEIDSTALFKDSSFWNTNRIVSLDSNEVLAYQYADSLPVKKDTSIAHTSKKFGWQLGILLNGSYTPSDSTKISGYWRSPLSGLYLNTVDGWGLKLFSRFQTSNVLNKFWTCSLEGSIPFERKALNGSVSFDYFNKSTPQNQLGIEAGSVLKDFNPMGANAFSNAFQLIFYHSNNTRLFQEDYFRVHLKHALSASFVLNAEVKVGNRNSHENCYRYEQLEPLHIGITPNNETRDGSLFRTLDFNTFQLCNLKLGFEWNYKRYILQRKGRNYVMPSNYPSISFSLTKSLPGIWGSDLNYTKVNFKLSQQVKLWHWFELKYLLEAGKFLQARTLNFPDFFSFDGNTAWIMNDESGNRFFNLPFYMYSTNQKFGMGKLTLNFKRIALLRLPYFNKTACKESIKINFLGTPSFHKYTEIGYGLVNIFRVVDCYVYANYFNTQYQDWGFRLNLKIPLTF